MDMGYHLVDVLLWLCGVPNEVCCTLSHAAIPDSDYDAEDTVSVTFRGCADTQLWGNLLISRVLPPKQEFVHIVGTEGSIKIDRSEVSLFDRGGQILEQFSCAQKISDDALQVHRFLKRVREDELHHDALEDQVKCIAFIEACYLSHTRKQFTPVKLDPVLALPTIRQSKTEVQEVIV